VIDEFQSQFTYADELFSEVYDRDPIKEKYPLLFLTARAPGHSNIGPQTHLNLVEANRRQLLAAGIPEDHIWVAKECTSCRTDLLFSHRAEAGYTGRMMGVIGIRK
jgi:copper oxidase (laccase) domain-containing protein